MRSLAGITLALGLVACGSDRPTSPLEPPSPVVPGAATGPTRIQFVAAAPAPDAVISGCGPDGRACARPVTMAFDLHPSATGHVLYVVGFLHATDLRACHVARTGPFELVAGGTRRVTLEFEPQGCPPHDIATMAVVVEGTIEVASRQEWAVRYQFRP